jgi:E-phenylitaconyl-CoA hydratase
MDSTLDDEVLLDVTDHVAYVTINRPDRANSMTPSMLTWFQDFWRRVADDADIRCVVITGSGPKHFCTGADLKGVNERGGVGVGLGRVSQDIGLTARHHGVWKPTVCAVNGLVVGAGLDENVGLAKRLPLGTALRMSLQGRNFRLPAERAYQLGLVDELTEPDQLMTVAGQIARDITANSPHAVSLTQQAVWSSLEMPYTQAVEYGFSLVKTQWHHPDYTEGFRAFAEKRPPRWKTD